MSDFMNRTAGLGYANGALVLIGRTPWGPPPAISWPTTRDSASSPAPSSSPLRSY
ncbi:hypothetical protein ACTXG6_09150 [Pseudonocardia sp. Cha107L01]|uniref:hypothetical protein n=1 Tax=Pseudonocardia sp. Cha107L01 TaxID=3457576 RepID=UPI00403EC0D3